MEHDPKVINVWAVNQGDDDRSCGRPVWFFDSAAKAEEVAAGRGWFGGNAPVGEHKAILFGNQIYLLAKTEPIELNLGPQDQAERRKKAIEKLTPAERKLLGISDSA